MFFINFLSHLNLSFIFIIITDYCSIVILVFDIIINVVIVIVNVFTII